jgi:PilZ domain
VLDLNVFADIYANRGDLLNSSSRWFHVPFMYRSRAERRESPALAAIHWHGSTPRQAHVANLSTSGAYVLTEERWKPGEIVSLTLQRAGALEHAPQRRFTIQAKTIRHDKEGVGVAFLMPRGSDVWLWQSSIKAGIPQTEPEDVVREFRLSSAISFIHRLAPEATQKTKLLLREGLSNHRLEGAVEIALHAQDLLDIEMGSSDFRVDPTVVLRVLDDGSWSEAEWIQHFWGGLLSTACSDSKPDKSHLKFVNLLSQLTTIQARIFAGSCERALKSEEGNGRVSARPLVCSAEELVKIADTHDRVHIERDIQQLVDLGLIEKSVKWKFFCQIDEAVLTPTPVALELYARCHGHRGKVAEFYEGVPCAAGIAADD